MIGHHAASSFVFKVFQWGVVLFIITVYIHIEYIYIDTHLRLCVLM